MNDWIIVADELKDLQWLGAPYRMMATLDYAGQPGLFDGKRPKIVNLSRSYGYQTIGYYASLLAEARGHRVVPAVQTMLDLAARDGYAQAMPELEEALNRDLRAHAEPGPSRTLICFGTPDDFRLRKFAQALFDWYRAPAISVTLDHKEGWSRIKRVTLVTIAGLKGDERSHFATALTAYTNRVWRSPKQKAPPRFSIAVLQDPKEALPPSTMDSMKHWARLCEKDGVEIEPITRKDYGKLAEFDALFIRETTSITNHTYRFARRAAAEGMPVIDDPVSMMRCTNKVYLWERLSFAGLPTPDTMLLRDGAPLAPVADKLGLPVVLKIPDGSFSRGVKKADTLDELKRLAAAFFVETDLVIAQRFVPTPFDWRLGVLDGEPLFLCQYAMAKGHWQIANHKSNGVTDEGRSRAVALAQAPREIVDIGMRAARLIGDGLYGVDIKEGPNGPLVIEINDNPNLEHGVEDAAEKGEVWARLTNWFVTRLRA